MKEIHITSVQKKVSLLSITALFLVSCTTSNPVAKRTVHVEGVQLSRHFNQHEELAAKGLQQLAKGELDSASNSFNLALRLNPKSADYHLLNAITYHLKAINGNSATYKLAKEGYELAIKFDPSRWFSFYMYGQLLIEQGEFKKAEAQLAKAILLENKEPYLIRTLAYAAYRNGDIQTAVAMMDRLRSMGKLEKVQDLRNAALIYAASGDSKQAKKYLRQLAKKDRNGWRFRKANRRVTDWQGTYKALSGMQKTAWDDSSGTSNWAGATGDGNSWNETGGSGFDTAAANNDFANPISAKGSDLNKMALVDVVIIRTEESIGEYQGVNLLNGLKIQFGNQGGTAAWSRQTDNRRVSDGSNNITSGDSSSLSLTDNVSLNVTDSITTAISIPALSYSLNIFNTASQRNEILARPTIVAMAGQRSEFFSGVELNAAAVSQSTVGGQSVQINKQIGVKLAVTPNFTREGKIKLAVQAERTFLKTPSSDVNFDFKVETSKTTVSANVVMRFGETLILSGLSEKETGTSRDGVPLLQDIPLLQYLFSQNSKVQFQKSVLILLTPRPAQYIYQPENARKEWEQSLSEDERPIANLRARYADWFKPYPNWASVFKHMQQNGLYREFRTGDVELEQWSSSKELANRLKQTLDFLWY